MPGAVHQIEKGTMGEDPNRPRELPGLLLLLTPHSQGPLEIKDQHTTRKASTKETEIGGDGAERRRGKQEGCCERGEPMWPSLITQRQTTR
uniref:Uncharacterized protein n=1 Tax=Knipowitschia caucasica TaxID=637954 RepID=A0AAV2LZX0_KNICA